MSLLNATQNYMQLKLQPISSAVVEGQRRVTQDMTIVNSEDGKKPLALKIKVQYMTSAG